MLALAKSQIIHRISFIFQIALATLLFAHLSPVKGDETSLTKRLKNLDANINKYYPKPTQDESKPQSIAEIGLTGEWRWFPDKRPYAIRVTAVEPGSVLANARDLQHPERRIQPGDYLVLTRRVEFEKDWRGDQMIVHYPSSNFNGIYLALAHLTTYNFNEKPGHAFFEVSRFREGILAEEAKLDSDVVFFESRFKFDLNIPPENMSKLKEVAATIPSNATYSNFTYPNPKDFNVKKFGPPSLDFSSLERKPIDLTTVLLGIATAAAVVAVTTEQGEQTGICNKRAAPVWLAIAREDHNKFWRPNLSAPTLTVETNIKLAPGNCHDRRVTEDHNMWYAVYEIAGGGITPLIFSASGERKIDYAEDRTVSHLCVDPKIAVTSRLNSYEYAGSTCPRGSVAVPVSFGLKGRTASSQTVTLQ